MTEQEKIEFLKQKQINDQKLLENGGERCVHCQEVWEDPIAAMLCPCLESQEWETGVIEMKQRLENGDII